MGYIELVLDSAVANSSSTKYLKTDTPIFNLDTPLKNVKSIKVIEAIIPQTWYNYTRPLVFSGGVPVDAIVDGVQQFAPHGHQIWRLKLYNPSNSNVAYINFNEGGYSTAQLAIYLNDYFNLPSFPATFLALTGETLTTASVTYNPGAETISFRFTHSPNGIGPIMLGISVEDFTSGEYGLPYVAHVLGLRNILNPFMTTLGTTTFTTQFCNANPFNFVSIRSRSIGTQFDVISNSNITPNTYDFQLQNISETLAVIPLSGNFGSITNWQDPDPYRKFMGVEKLDKIDLYLTLGPYILEPLNLNQASFQVKFGIETFEEEELVSTNKRLRF